MICMFLTKIRKSLLLNFEATWSPEQVFALLLLQKMRWGRGWISREKDKKIFLSCCYRQPNGDRENLDVLFQNKIIEKSISKKKNTYIKGDFNMNCLKHRKNFKTEHFYDSILSYILLINYPTRVSEDLASLTNNNLTKSILKIFCKLGCSQSFSNIFLNTTTKRNIKRGYYKHKKRVFKGCNMNYFKEQMSLLQWRHVGFNGIANAKNVRKI